MSQKNFDQLTQYLLIHEGGYVNHPKDPGGATNKGVTQRVYTAYRKRMGREDRSVRHIEMSEVMDIYRTQYWDAVDGDLLPVGLDYAVYDFAVNSGPDRAVKFLQRILRVREDGIIGNLTLEAIRGVNNIEGLIEEYCVSRWEWMQTLKTWDTFGRGWTRRVMGDHMGTQADSDTGVVDRSVKMVRGVSISAPKMEAPGKALEEDTKRRVMVLDAVTDDKNLIAAAIGGIPSTLGALAIIPEGPLQWGVVGLMLIAAVFVGAIVWKRLNQTAG